MFCILVKKSVRWEPDSTERYQDKSEEIRNLPVVFTTKVVQFTTALIYV